MRSQTIAPQGAPATGQPLLVARDQRVVEAVLAAAAAAGVDVQVARDPAVVRAAWRSAPCVLVGVEMAALVCGIALEPRSGVHVVGTSQDELVGWSAPLQAAVLVLPEHSATLTQVLDQGRAGAGDAVVVRLVGGSGGLGVSTLACSLAQRAAARSMTAAVVELDPLGGGLDLVFGAEAEPGWRWVDLRQAAGHVDALTGRLPNVAGVDVVAHARPDPARPAEPPGAEAVRSVVGSLCRSHQLVVLDAGNGTDALLDAWPGQRQVLVCGADVRGVVAASSRAVGLGLHDVELVVRTGAGRRIAPEAVAENLGIPLLGAYGDDERVPRAAESGLPPALGRRGYARQVEQLLGELLPPAQPDGPRWKRGR